MRVDHLIGNLDPSSGGPAFFLPALCRGLVSQGISTELHFCGKKHTNIDGLNAHNYPLGRIGARQGLSIPQYQAVKRSMADLELLHSHGLWMMQSRYGDLISRKASVPHVVSTHGMLSPVALAKSPLRKKIVWKLLQRSILDRATCIHATSERERQDIRKAGIKTPVAVIPIGCDLPVDPIYSSHVDRPRRVLYLGRLDPIKCLPRLIEAWRRIGSVSANWELHIVGSGLDNHIASLIQQVKSFNGTNIHIRPPVYGKEKSEEYFKADLFVLPSNTENFSLSVAEALSHGLPAIVSQGAPWEIIHKADCGWWVENDVESLQSHLQIAMGLSRDELRAYGLRAAALIEQNFSWEKVSQQYCALYEWLIAGGTEPVFVDAE